MKILIRGAGDLATGIVSRLYNAGYREIVMTEKAVPLTVRRTVALSRAVYEGRAEVENLTGILATDINDVKFIISQGNIPIMIDEKGEIMNVFKPDVLIDAIIAKKNLGTAIDMAPLVIGVGPGFNAGIDCNYVVETKRGHYLGSVIRTGMAIPNTGIPGDIGGYTIERLIKASADGVMEPLVEIGDVVEKGDIVARTGGKAVYAKMSGMVRGMLQSGVKVTEGLKIGDIDSRCEREHCYTISDKARAIGGGVLEIVVGYEHSLA